MNSFTDTVVCITNPCGLGLLLARRFAEDGARLVISTPDVAELERAHEDLTQRGADVLAYPCDVTDAGSVRELLKMAVRWFGRVDVLVNVSSPGASGQALVNVVEQPLLRAGN